MQENRRKRAGLNALGIFEAAGRHMSFTAAAAELNVTQGAVSRQIRLLEQQLGFDLFARLHRAVKFTAEGQQLHQAVTASLGQIDNAISAITDSLDSGKLTLAATHAVSSYWLMPRLPRLRARFADADIHVLATDRELNEVGNWFDVGIAYGPCRWPGFRTIALGRSEIFAVCAPQYEPAVEVERAEDLLRQTNLLHLVDQRPDWIDWPGWFRALDIAGPYPPRRMRANSYSLLLQAAIGGQGFALGWRHLVETALATGTLVAPLAESIETQHEFHLCVPQQGERSPTQAAWVEAMTEWFVEEFRAARPVA